MLDRENKAREKRRWSVQDYRTSIFCPSQTLHALTDCNMSTSTIEGEPPTKRLKHDDIVVFNPSTLALEVDKLPKQTILRVSRDVMCACSPIFKTKLHGGLNEAGKDFLSLPNDDFDTVHLFCMIAHGREADVDEVTAEKIIGLIRLAHLW